MGLCLSNRGHVFANSVRHKFRVKDSNMRQINKSLININFADTCEERIPRLGESN